MFEAVWSRDVVTDHFWRLDQTPSRRTTFTGKRNQPPKHIMAVNSKDTNEFTAPVRFTNGLFNSLSYLVALSRLNNHIRFKLLKICLQAGVSEGLILDCVAIWSKTGKDSVPFISLNELKKMRLGGEYFVKDKMHLSGL